MDQPERRAARDRGLARLLRFLGTVDLLAIVVAFLPRDAIDQVNRGLRLGSLPDGTLAEYLIRSTSVLYALHGGLLLAMAQNVERYRPLIRWLGILAVAHGLVMARVDFVIGMPKWWCWTEGPVFAACGLAVWRLAAPPPSDPPVRRS